MRQQNLDELIRAAGGPVPFLRQSQTGPYAFPVVRSEFTNWRDEQRAWRETCALFDLSHHMTDLTIEGPDARSLLAALGVNSFSRVSTTQAKQFIACNNDGYVIGDAILFPLGPDRFSLVGRPAAANWVQYNLETGGYDARAERDERSAANPRGRRTFRYQIQGPHAPALMSALTGKPAPDIRFFHMTVVSIAGHDVKALRHGMVGQPGWEIFGPWEIGEAVRSAILDAGREFRLRQVGSRAYPTTTLESGWIPSPVPAIYSDAALQGYREWLGPTSYEATASLGGSFVSDEIADYYLTPYELGYGPFVKFDHDFVGRQALERLEGKTRRRKVTLVWNGDDVAAVFASLFGPRAGGTEIAKYIDLPLANYATLPYDAVLKNGRTIGLSTYTGYSYNERTMLSLAVVDTDFADPGTEVTVVWGEEDGGTSKPTVERHVQAEIRATVAPVPYSDVAREFYRS